MKIGMPNDHQSLGRMPLNDAPCIQNIHADQDQLEKMFVYVFKIQ
jgi:hypothetical protein